MKIGIVAENWPPRVGGIEQYITHIAQAFDPVPIAYVPPGSSSVSNVTIRQTRFYWPIVKPAWLPLYIAIHRAAKRGEIDMLVCGKALFEGQIGYYLNRSLKIPYTIFTYGMEINTWVTNERTKRQLVRVLKNARSIFYINDLTRNQLKELGAQDQQLRELLPGVDDKFVTPVAAAAVTQWRRANSLKRPYIINVGRLIPRKGLDTLLAAFEIIVRSVPDVDLVIVGDGPDKDRLQGIATERGLTSHVHFMGYVADEKLPILYAGAELFVLTPKNIAGDIEGFGIVYIEAAAAGLTSVGTTTGGVAKAVIDNETGLLTAPDDPTSVAKAVMRLLQDSDLRNRLATNAKQRAASMSWSKRRPEIRALFEGIYSGVDYSNDSLQ